jgi:hypothetical protein
MAIISLIRDEAIYGVGRGVSALVFDVVAVFAKPS